MAENVKTVDVNKTDGKSVVEFSPEFLASFDKSISMYDETLDQLQALVQGKGFDEEYGICNCRYEMRYITPNDISAFISDLLKAISMKLIACDIADLEKFSVEMAKNFIHRNTGECIEPDNIFATSKYADPRSETLMDMLVQTENTFFDRCVYSKFEMEKRAKDMKGDYDKINGMHFGAAMKALVKALPDVIKKAMRESILNGIVCCNCDTVMTYIETFILFACGLNTCMLTQMIGYCEPMTTYLRKDKAVVTQESVSTRSHKPVFVCLLSGTNIVSNTIKKFTHSKWSHAAISFDTTMEEMYSYTFATTEYAKASQGLRRESIKMLDKIDGEVCVYGFYVPNKIYDAMRNEIKRRIDSGRTKYDLGLLVKKAFDDDASQNSDYNKKICSAFVNSIIAEFVGTISDKNSPSPDDMSKALQTLPTNQFKKLYEGPCTMYDQSTVISQLKKFAKDAETKTFSEYVTEFCLVKTNDMTIRSRIPFDCNMRNIVLQDCTPDFKDTKSAIHFMMKDNRSPIHAMLIESATDKQIAGRAACNPTLQMFEPYFRPCDGHNPLAFEYDRAGFLTDVNWLDKIAYGNNFLDGNYRMDAMGNDNRHPIYVTLQMLHKMYCGCSLKTNEELSNNILKIAGVMLAIIAEQPWVCYNKDLVKDILAVLGECFTRNVIKLYNNHCTIVTYSDNMADTMSPGYTYCEAFVYMEADGQPQPGEKAAPASVEFEDPKTGQNTAPKTGTLSKLATIMRQFVEWIQKKLANISPMFSKINGAKVQYVTAHAKQNEIIGNDIGQKFKPFVKNFPRYKIPASEIISRTDAVKQALELYSNSDEPIDPVKIKEMIFPGDKNVKQTLAQMPDQKQLAQCIQNYVLYSQATTTPENTVFSGELTKDMWTDLCSNITQSQKLVDEVCKSMVKSLQDGMKALEAIRKKEETASNKVHTEAEGTTPTQPTTGSRAQQLFDIFQQCAQIYHINVMNSITNTFFNTSYRLYTEILKGYQSGNYILKDQQASPQPENTAAPQNPQTQKQ